VAVIEIRARTFFVDEENGIQFAPAITYQMKRDGETRCEGELDIGKLHEKLYEVVKDAPEMTLRSMTADEVREYLAAEEEDDE
jgi:hypothetical protein